ncbi:MAG TPA: hypothetical protein VEB00_05450 [Clostridia bacterium]|nr:hypothetical protein [Clostridia bacterium]
MTKGFIETEIKILNIDVNFVISRLQKVGAVFIEENIQKIYTYDVNPISTTYKSLLFELNEKRYNIKNEDILLKRINAVFSDMDHIINDKDREKFYKITNYFSMQEFSKSIKKIDSSIIKLLNEDSLISIINSYYINPGKWIRLRETGNEVTITVKQKIGNNKVNSDNKYQIDSIREIEVKVDSLEKGNLLLSELGFFYRNYQEKKRISYLYKDKISIDIDFWPFIPPYIEIEGENKDEIYEVARMLGYGNDEIKVMNTDEVYLIYGINIYDYKELKLDRPLMQL